MDTSTINGQECYVDELLETYTIEAKESSNVEFYGHDNEGRVFVQFNNGCSYLYHNVPAEAIKEMASTESIGSCINQLIVKPNIYPSIKHSRRLVRLVEDIETGEQW